MNEAAQVIQFPRDTVPFDEFLALNDRLDELATELAATRRALTASHRREGKLKRELADVYEEAADAATVKTIITYWRDKTGRNGRTRIDLTGARADRVRWALKHWTPREVCLMCIGVMHEGDGWWARNDKTELADHILRDEARAERFLKAGRLAIGEQE